MSLPNIPPGTTAAPASPRIAKIRRGIFVFGIALLTVLVLLIAFVVFLPRPGPTSEPPRVQFPPRDFHRYDPTKIDLHVGSRRFNVGVDYVILQPFVGGRFYLHLVWPSMRTVDEEVEVYGANVEGKRGVRVSDTIEIWIDKIEIPSRFSDEFNAFHPDRFPYETLPELGLYLRHSGGEMYWAMDPAVLTPLQKVPYTFTCAFASEIRRQICHGAFQLHPDLQVWIGFNKVHLKDWKLIYFKSLEFIRSIEEAS